MGTIQVHVDETSARTEASKSYSRLPLATSDAERSSVNADVSVPSYPFDAFKMLRSLGEGSLVLWIGLLTARLLFDPAFRELVSVAPLAAISRMILGIQ